ncbi:MAG: hypothetical protein AB1749_15995 [Pseudomonadota bacterium]
MKASRPSKLRQTRGWSNRDRELTVWCIRRHAPAWITGEDQFSKPALTDNSVAHLVLDLTWDGDGLMRPDDGPHIGADAISDPILAVRGERA